MNVAWSIPLAKQTTLPCMPSITKPPHKLYHIMYVFCRRLSSSNTCVPATQRWARERVAWSHGADQRVVVVLPDDGAPQQRKARQVCASLETQLSLAPGWLLRNAPKVSRTSLSSSPSDPQSLSHRAHAGVFIHHQQAHRRLCHCRAHRPSTGGHAPPGRRRMSDT